MPGLVTIRGQTTSRKAIKGLKQRIADADKLPSVRTCDMDAVIRERDDSCPRFPDEEEALAGDERVGGGQLLLLLHRRPHREHLGSLHHCEHNLHRRLSGKQIVKFTS